MTGELGPSFALVRAHFGLGLAGLLVFAGTLAWNAGDVTGFFFQPLLVSLVHLCVLGWLMPTAIGALHQLAPVVFEVPVRSERLAWVALGLYASGVVALVSEMWTLDGGLALSIAGTLVAASVWLYVFNLAATLLRSKERSLTGRHVVSALVYLVVAVTLGALLAWNVDASFLPVFHIQALRMHAHVAAFGFFGVLIMGVAYRLLEMFLLSHGAPERAGQVALVAAHGAVWALSLGFWFEVEELVHAGAISAALAVATFLVQVREIYRRRLQKKPDIAWRHTFTSFVYLGLTLTAGAALAILPIPEPYWDRLHLTYALFALPGFIGTMVVGQLYKIVPFLVWLHRFSPLVGLKKVPSAAELLGEGPKRAQYLLMHAGLAALAVGLVLDLPELRGAGALSFAASAALFARNLGLVLVRKP